MEGPTDSVRRPEMVEIPLRNRDRYAQCKLCIVQVCGAAGDMAVGKVAAMGDVCLIFEAFFGLRPAGRRGPRWRGRREFDSQVFCHPN